MLTTMILFGVLAAALCVLGWELRRRSTDRAFVGRRVPIRLTGPEVLEARLTPASHDWVGGTLVGGLPTNDWLVAANWSDKTIPVAGDTVNFNATSFNDCVLPAGGGVIQVDTVHINPGYAFTLNLNGSTLLVTSLLDFSDPQGAIDGGGGEVLGNLRIAASLGNNAAFNWSGGSLTRTALYVGQGLAQAATGNFTWSGGTAIDSSLFFLADSTAHATGGKLEADNCLLSNAGTFTISGTISFAGGNEVNIGELDMDFGTLKTVVGAGVPVAHFNQCWYIPNRGTGLTAASGQ